jgi:nucleoside-diphosphate-sugar epimerase
MPRVLIIGAAGAVGKRLCSALSRAGADVVAADRMQFIPSTVRYVAKTCVGNVDVRDREAMRALFKEHVDENTTVWNLASPLSVETAMNPEVAEAITIGGMKNTIEAMKEVGCRRICFTDSIGSFGCTSPRDDIAGSWLVENPTQDPGSDYGRQKRACRELLNEFATQHGGDPRIAVLPGVLHSEPVWGNGTTEYALDALLAASRGQAYECPIGPEVKLPMVYVDDLMRVRPTPPSLSGTFFCRAFSSSTLVLTPVGTYHAQMRAGPAGTPVCGRGRAVGARAGLLHAGPYVLATGPLRGDPPLQAGL